MTFLLLLPALLSFLILAAHFLHGQYLLAALAADLPFGQPVMAAICLSCIFWLLIRRRWVMRAMQTILLLATAEWVLTGYADMQARQAGLRPLIIFSAVAALNLLAAALFQTPRLRAHYPPTQSPPAPPSAP